MHKAEIHSEGDVTIVAEGSAMRSLKEAKGR
jgi:hypothetical protein